MMASTPYRCVTWHLRRAIAASSTTPTSRCEVPRPASNSLRGRLRGLGPAPSTGPWVAPPALEARHAGDRPEGASAHAAGHGSTDAPAFSLADRSDGDAAPLSAQGRTFHRQFVDAVDDDLDLPRALATVREVLRSRFSDDEKRWLALDADLVLGLDLQHAWDDEPAASIETELPLQVQQLASDRVAARGAGDYAEADRLRDALAALGFDVIDRPGGTDVTPRP